MFKDQDEASRVILTEELHWSTRLLKIGALLIGIGFLAYTFEMVLTLLVVVGVTLPNILSLFLQISTSLFLSFATFSVIVFAIGFNKLGKYLPLRNKTLINAVIIIVLIQLITGLIFDILVNVFAYLAIEGEFDVLAIGYLSVIGKYLIIIFISMIFLLFSLTFNKLNKEQGLPVKSLISALILPIWILVSAVSIILFAILEINILSIIYGASNILFGINGLIVCFEFFIQLTKFEEI
ncbi:MAG: hypothetical protein EAX90_13470 [Candidatus Heimdallarchaeota archaeon]|nr:hypothetical protein [Candidatus Heimdallarchaeota archaeon]